MSDKYEEFHKIFLKNIETEGFLHDNHIHPVILLWVDIKTQEKKEELITFLKNEDEEFGDELDNYLVNFNIEKEIIPIYLPFHAESEEEYEGIFSFIIDLKDIVKVHFYSILSEITLTEDDDKEEEEEPKYYPSVLSESEEGKCYMAVIDYKDKSLIKEYTGIYDKDHEFVSEIRLPIFD